MANPTSIALLERFRVELYEEHIATHSSPVPSSRPATVLWSKRPSPWLTSVTRYTDALSASDTSVTRKIDTSPGFDILAGLPTELQLEILCQLQPRDFTALAAVYPWFEDFVVTHFQILLRRHLPEWLPEECMQHIYSLPLSRPPGITSSDVSCDKCRRLHFDLSSMKSFLPRNRDCQDLQESIALTTLPASFERTLKNWDHIFNEVRHIICARETLYKDTTVQLRDINSRHTNGHPWASNLLPRMSLHAFSTVPRIRHFLSVCFRDITVRKVAFRSPGWFTDEIEGDDYMFLVDLEKPADAERILRFMLDRLMEGCIMVPDEKVRVGLLVFEDNEIKRNDVGTWTRRYADHVVGPDFEGECGGVIVGLGMGLKRGRVRGWESE